MARDPLPDTSATVDRLRLAAVELFGERGYSGTSMSDLAERVGIAKASLYNYYPSKEDLLVDLVGRALEEWNGRTLAPLHEPGPLEERLRRHFEAVFDLVERDPHVVGVLRLATSLLPGEPRGRIQSLLDEDRAATLADAHRLVAEGIERGELTGAGADELILFGEVFMNGLILSSAGCPALAEPLRERRQALWRLFWRALSGRFPQETTPP